MRSYVAPFPQAAGRRSVGVRVLGGRRTPTERLPAAWGKGATYDRIHWRFLLLTSNFQLSIGWTSTPRALGKPFQFQRFLALPSPTEFYFNDFTRFNKS